MRETFTTVYNKLARYRKRCRQCNKLIQDGQSATFWKVKKHGRGHQFYFTTAWLPFHESCYDQMISEESEVLEPGCHSNHPDATATECDLEEVN